MAGKKFVDKLSTDNQPVIIGRSLREHQYVESAIYIGSSNRRIVSKALLLKIWALILAFTTILMPALIGERTTLANLDFSVLPLTPTWGPTSQESVGYFTVDPFYFFAPVAMVLTALLLFNLLSDALRDALDPKSGRA